MSEKRVIITGATGMAGGCALRICLDNKEPNLMYTVSRYLYPLVRRIYPNIGISSEDPARAMVNAGLHETGENENPVLENRDIRSMEKET
jgi:hypothetical protein